MRFARRRGASPPVRKSSTSSSPPTGVVAWPAMWAFSHSRQLIDAALLAAGRFLDDLDIRGPGLYRPDTSAAAARLGADDKLAAALSGGGR